MSYAMARYMVECWGGEDDGLNEPPFGWSGELARRVLGGPNAGLTWRQIGLAIRKLYDSGWSNVSIHVEREDE